MRIWNLVVLAVAGAALLSAQEERLHLQNPSFELDQRACCVVPAFWYDLGEELETPPDIQPGAYDVELKAWHGEKYVSLVVRDNGTREGIGQTLQGGALRQGERYVFSLLLARSSIFNSLSRVRQMPVSFVRAAAVRISAYDPETQMRETLIETPIVAHTDWRQYDLEISPRERDYTDIWIEAIHEPEAKEYYNGHVLVDNISPIVRKNQ